MNICVSGEQLVTVFLCGDVMTGRGIDQILPHPSDPRLYEAFVTDARTYVALAEDVNGPIPGPVEFSYIWGDALAELQHVAPEARIVNLETSVTVSDEPWPKGINYRMHPANVGCLTAAWIDVCSSRGIAALLPAATVPPGLPGRGTYWG
jgi:poly-gamma-glutamate synthesis protein (capsule biosynthesis protein)